MNKPMSVALREFKEKIVEDVNNSGLPLFAIEPILKDLLSVVQMESERVYQMEKKAYEESLKTEEASN